MKGEFGLCWQLSATLARHATMISAREPIQDIESIVAAYHASIRRLALPILNDHAAQETFIAASRAGASPAPLRTGAPSRSRSRPWRRITSNEQDHEAPNGIHLPAM
jgi:hypothetical protein